MRHETCITVKINFSHMRYPGRRLAKQRPVVHTTGAIGACREVIHGKNST